MTGNDSTSQAVVALIRRGKEFLFIKRSATSDHGQGYWCPISGKIKTGEPQQQAVQREVREEIGLEVTGLEMVAEIPSDNKQFTLYFWTTRIVSGEPRICNAEVADYGWFTLAELDKLQPVFEEDIEIIRQLSH